MPALTGSITFTRLQGMIGPARGDSIAQRTAASRSPLFAGFDLLARRNRPAFVPIAWEDEEEEDDDDLLDDEDDLLGDEDDDFFEDDDDDDDVDGDEEEVVEEEP